MTTRHVCQHAETQNTAIRCACLSIIDLEDEKRTLIGMDARDNLFSTFLKNMREAP